MAKNEEHLTTHFWKMAYLHWERYILYIYIQEMNTFENFIFLRKVFFFFTSQLSCSDPLASLVEKGNTFYNNHICILYIKI